MPRVLYLDLKDWIDLTKGRLQRPGHDVQLRVYERLRAVVSEGDVVVPLSTMHYMELFNIKDPHQRADLALTMDEISRYVALTAREILIGDELRRSLAAVFGRPYAAPRPRSIGYGAAHAFGRAGRMRISGPHKALERWVQRTGDDVVARIEKFAGYGWRYIASVPTTHSSLERIEDALDRATQFAILRGPDDDDLPKLGQYGYDPLPARRIVDAIRQREAELARLLAAEPVAPSRLAEYVSARAFYWDLREDWESALTDVGLGGLTLEEVGKDRIHDIVAGIPIVAVESAIRQRRFRNGSYVWSTNDVYDLGFVGQAVVYCDALLTDKDVRSHVVNQQLDRKYGVAMPRDLDALLAWLDSTASQRLAEDKEEVRG